MIVLVTVPLGDRARRQIVECVSEFGGEVVFSENVTDVKVSPTVIFGGAPLEYITVQEGLRWVQTHSAGVDHLVGRPIPFPRHVKLTNASGVYGTAGGEHILAMMLYFARGLYVYRRHQQDGAWVRDLSHARLLHGETLCVLGLGDIGRQVVAGPDPSGCGSSASGEILPRWKGLNGSSHWTIWTRRCRRRTIWRSRSRSLVRRGE